MQEGRQVGRGKVVYGLVGQKEKLEVNRKNQWGAGEAV